MKVLLIGASGVLGSKLYGDAIRKKWNVMGTYYSRDREGLFCLDLTDKKGINSTFHFFKPEVIVLAGGITDVDLCEVKPRFARSVNIDGTFNIIKKAKEFSAKLVFLSTDYIFDGKAGPYNEYTKPSPINVYGRTKLEAENSIRSHLKDYLIIRTSQLYGYDCRKKNFAMKIVSNMKKNKKVYAADDFYSTPTYVGSLSSGIMQLLKKDKKGIFNIAGTDFINRYEYVKKIADVFELKKSLIQKVKLEDLGLKAHRPKRGGLKIDKIEKEIDGSLLNCREGLELFKEESL